MYFKTLKAYSNTSAEMLKMNSSKKCKNIFFFYNVTGLKDLLKH